MTDEEFLTIEDSLRAFAEQLGAPDIADDRHYRVEHFDEGGRLLPPRERVLAKLEALDRQLALRDRRTFDNAMEKIRSLLQPEVRGESFVNLPEGAAVLLDRRLGEGTERFDFGELPDLTAARLRLRALADRLREA